MIFPAAVAGTGRGNYQAAVQEDQEGRGQGAGGRAGRARNADSVDTELTGGDLGHGMGTLLHIAPLWSRAIIIVSVSCFIMI